MLDLLSGSYSRHDPDMAGLFQVLWGKAGGGFGAATTLCGSDGEPLIIAHAGRGEVTEAICTRPFAIDWDGDGDLDLVVGNFRGTFHLFRGEGQGRFAPRSEAILCNGKPLQIDGAHGDPFCVDWDGDGDLDLLSGSSQGGVRWAQNVGDGTGEPVLRPFATLIEARPAQSDAGLLAEAQLAEAQEDTRVWVADVDGDGKLDILVGDTVTLGAPAEGLTREQYLERRRAWDEESRAVSQELARASDADARRKLQERYSALYERRKEFLHEERTGYVWLYRRR
ncbi:MAG: VCBS repeat-containing protein [Planctomycetes bacterium]|nr:VCBS repeat-containing protein [Planctomycetota bacterium]